MKWFKLVNKKSNDEIETWLEKYLPQWNFETNQITRTYETGSWQLTLLLANTIGFIAEAAWHHPDIHLSYPRVKVILQSHDAGGITERDFELAKKIEEAVLWYPKDQALEGTPNKWIKQ